MKRKFILILLVLLAGSIPFGIVPVQSAENGVPVPEFKSITPDGDPSGSYRYNENETVTVMYTVEDRTLGSDEFLIDGLVLLGIGSNLTEVYANGIEFERVKSLKETSTFEVEFNVTSNTIFYAYAWKDNKTALEEFENYDNTFGHAIWMDGDPSFPEFVDIEGAIDKGSNYYVPEGKNVRIEYQVFDPFDNQTVTLSFGLNNTAVFNDTHSTRYVMIKIDHNSETNYTSFAFNYTLTDRIVTFSAFSDEGWERQALNSNAAFVHVLTNGFSFTKTFSEDISEYTDFDFIKVNVTAFNQTNDDDFFVRYRAFENDSSDLPFMNWSDIALLNNISYSLNNDTNNFNTTEHVYQAVLPNFNVSQVVEVQAYVNYKTGTFNESDPVRIVINDGRPSISIDLTNNTLTNKGSLNATIDITTVRGEITEATLISNFTTSVNIKEEDIVTIKFMNSTGFIHDGVHIANFTVTNDLNASRTKLLFFKVDTTAPTASFLASSDTVSNKQGMVTLDFVFEDDGGVLKSGMASASLDWGDGIAIKVLNRTSASHTYRYTDADGIYEVTLTVEDLAGNSFELQYEVTIDLEVTSVTSTSASLNPLFSILSISVMVYILRRKK